MAPQGPPFASAIVDSAETSLPGSQAAVGVTLDGFNVHFTFRIPQGIPCEVSMIQLNDAIVTGCPPTSPWACDSLRWGAEK